MIDVTETPAGFKVEFEYRQWIVDAIKEFPGARYQDKDGEKYWLVPIASGVELFKWWRLVNDAQATSNLKSKN